MTDDFVHTQLIDISNRLGVLQGTMEAVLKEGQKTNGRVRDLEIDERIPNLQKEIIYMRPIVDDYSKNKDFLMKRALLLSCMIIAVFALSFVSGVKAEAVFDKIVDHVEIVK